MHYHEYRHEMKNPHFKRAMESISELEAENKTLRELVRDLIENDPNDPISDSGHVVLDLWRHHARAILSQEEKPSEQG